MQTGGATVDPATRHAGGLSHAEVQQRLRFLEQRVSAFSSPQAAVTGAFEAPRFRPIADPAPLGLFAFGLTTALLAAAIMGWVDSGVESLVWGVALAYGGLGQLLAGMWEFARNNVFGATALSTFGCFWIGLGLYQIFISSHVLVTASGVRGLEAFYALFGLFTFFMLIATVTHNIALLMVFLLLSLAFFCLAGGASNPTGATTKAGGYLAFLTAIAAWYLAAAGVYNNNFKRVILPIGVLTEYWMPRRPTKDLEMNHPDRNYNQTPNPDML